MSVWWKMLYMFNDSYESSHIPSRVFTTMLAINKKTLECFGASPFSLIPSHTSDLIVAQPISSSISHIPSSSSISQIPPSSSCCCRSSRRHWLVVVDLVVVDLRCSRLCYCCCWSPCGWFCGCVTCVCGFVTCVCSLMILRSADLLLFVLPLNFLIFVWFFVYFLLLLLVFETAKTDHDLTWNQGPKPFGFSSGSVLKFCKIKNAVRLRIWA